MDVFIRTYHNYEHELRLIPNNNVGIFTRKYGCSENSIYKESETTIFMIVIRHLTYFNGEKICINVTIQIQIYQKSNSTFLHN